MFDKKFMKKVIVILLLAVAAVVLSSCKKETPGDDPAPKGNDTPDVKAPDGKAEMIALPVELPEAIEGGTPIPVPELANLDKDSSEDRPLFYVPKGTTNVALNKTVTCPDEDVPAEELKKIVDGDMSGADGSWVELGLFDQQVTIDLGSQHEINAILIWHYFKEARVYLDVVVQTADDADFVTNVQTLFNSDIEDVHKQGAGTDKYYIEKPKGKLIDAKGIKGRYVRLFSNTNSVNDLNHYVEVAVFGKPVKVTMGFFYNLGRKAGPKIRKGQWIWHSLTGSADDAIAAEYNVGCDIAAALRMELPCDQSSDDAVLIQKIGKKLSQRVANKLRKFNFEIITDGPPNAFAVAGGFVFVTRSMLELCNRDEDELAFIIAHEMGHIIRGHSMDRLVSSTAFSVLSKRLPGVGAIGSWLKGTGLKLLESAYSQQNEFTADELGTKLALACGYDKNAAEKLLCRLARISKGPEDESLAKYFATHPPFNERIANVRKAINETAPKQLNPPAKDKA